jgi:hypothetical protein
MLARVDTPTTALPQLRRGLSETEIRALGTVTDVETAGRAFGISRNVARDLARRGEFPCAVIRVGRQYRVPVAGILRALGLDPESD